MTFDEAFDLPSGARVRVSDGQREPEQRDSVRWRMWRSHNFEGVIAEKIDGSPRRLRIELDPTASAHVSYIIDESVPHAFAAA